MDYGLKTHLTVPDLIAHGACTDGLKEFFDKNKINYTLFNASELIDLAKRQGVNASVAIKAANADGYGYGNGYGNGNGDGNGDGYGYGDGNGGI